MSNATRFALFALLAGCTSNILDDTGDLVDTGDTDTDTGTDTDTSVSDDEALGLYDNCAGAADGIAIVPGTHSGVTDDWTSDESGGCVANSGLGPDKVFRADLAADHVLTLEYGIVGNDTRIYLLEACGSSTCFNDVWINENGMDAAESIVYRNSTGAAKTVYAVLDSRDTLQSGDTWSLTVDVSTYTPPPVVDLSNDCAGAASLTPITASGTHNVAMDGFSNSLNMLDADDGCIYSSAGVDGLAVVTLEDGATMEATYRYGSTCDLAMYILTDCTDLDTCVDGSDSYPQPEFVEYQNTSGATQDVYLVLDGYSSSCWPTQADLGELTVNIDTPIDVSADTCGDLSSVSAAPAGSHFLGLGAATDSHDLASASESCTGLDTPGDDLLVPVTVGAGEAITAVFTPGDGDAALYLLDTCGDVDSCRAGFDRADPESLIWRNTTATAADMVLVVDSAHADAAHDEPSSGTLDISFSNPHGEDTCTTATTPLAAGTYEVVLSGMGNKREQPSSGGCLAATPGPDAILPVRLDAGQAMEAKFTRDAGNAVMYVLETCTDDDSCLIAADGNRNDQLVWRNTTGTARDYYVVIDTLEEIGDPEGAAAGTFTLGLFDPEGVDTCGDATTPVGAGTYEIVLAGATDTQQHDSDACDGPDTPGPDQILMVTVPDGQALKAQFAPLLGDASIYILDTCGTASSCLALSDEPTAELLSWTNETGSSADVFVVIDTAHASGEPEADVTGTLTLDIFQPTPGEIPLANSCVDLPPIPYVEEGTHAIVLDGFSNNLSLGSSSCTGWSSIGIDGFVPVRLAPGDLLDVSYDHSSCDLSLYLLEQCGDADTCVDGSDSGNPEQVSYQNDTGAFQDLVIGLDVWGSSSCFPSRANPGSLTVDITGLGADVCDDALDLAPLAEGSYFISLIEDYTSDVDLDAGDCTGAATAGDDLFFPISVPAGDAVFVSFDPDVGDPSLYLLEGCDPVECVAGSDDGVPEAVEYTNDSDDELELLIGVDSNYADGDGSRPGAGFLDIDIYTPVYPLTVSDTCDLADDLPSITAGHYSVSLDGHTNHVDLEGATGGACTDGFRTPGNDAFIYVELEDGEEVRLKWNTSSSTSGSTNGSLYLIEDCSDIDSCLVGSDSGDPESIRYTNETGSTEGLFIGLDSWSNSGGPNAGILKVSFY